jgi:hypothetical protein
MSVKPDPEIGSVWRSRDRRRGSQVVTVEAIERSHRLGCKVVRYQDSLGRPVRSQVWRFHRAFTPLPKPSPST